MRRIVAAAVLALSVLAVPNAVQAAPVRWSGPCHAAVDRYWPAHLRATAHHASIGLGFRQTSSNPDGAHPQFCKLAVYQA